VAAGVLDEGEAAVARAAAEARLRVIEADSFVSSKR
jgi:hypothetical protein